MTGSGCKLSVQGLTGGLKDQVCCNYSDEVVIKNSFHRKLKCFFSGKMATTATVPVVLSFGIENSVSCLRVVEVDREETLAQPVDKFGRDDWGDISTHIWLKMSHSN